MGLPHSEILGSQLVCSSPRLIAAYHVLRRLPVPRHPPCALTRLISVSRCDSSTPQHTTRQLSKSESVASRKPKVISLAAYALRLASDDDRAWKVRRSEEHTSELLSHSDLVC